MSEPALTKTVGYFNGNNHPIQLMVTRLGVTLILQPGQYILDKQGRKINDPFFDHYVAGGLRKETSTDNVPLVMIPEAKPAQVGPTAYAFRGSQNVQPTREAPQVKEPPRPMPVTQNHQASHVGMSVEEARKRGLIRRTREVPEDYGPSDTDGSPPRPADLKYATDTVRARKTELPAGLVEEAQQSPQAAPLVQALKQASASPAIANDTGFLNDVIKHVAPESPLQAGTPAERIQEVVQESASVKPVVNLPPPNLDEPDDGDDETEEADEVPHPQAASPGEVEEDEETMKAPVQRRYKRVATRDRFVCPLCNKPHKFRSQLLQHVQQSHPDQVQAVMAQFPVE